MRLYRQDLTCIDRTCSPMKDAMAIRANASFSKEKIISCITIEANANTMRVKALGPGSVRYENKKIGWTPTATTVVAIGVPPIDANK